MLTASSPLALIVVALTSVISAVPVLFPLTAAVVVAPLRHRWWVAGAAAVGLGLGAIAGMASLALGPAALMTGSAGMAFGVMQIVGAVCAGICGGLLLMRGKDAEGSTGLGIAAGALISPAISLSTVPAIMGLTASAMLALVGMLLHLLTLLAVGAALVALSGRWEPLNGGIAAAALVGAVIIMIEALGLMLASVRGIPFGVDLPIALALVAVAFAVGTVGAVVLRGRSVHSTPR